MKIVVVRIWIGDPYEGGYFKGTAFFIENNTLLTAKHVVINNQGVIYEKIYISDTQQNIHGKMYSDNYV